MMKKYTIVVALAALLAALSAGPASAQTSEGAVVKQSAFSVKETADKLVAVFKQKGITVFTQVDHAAGAKKVKRDIPPMVLIVFGNPKIGTPLIQSNPLAGIDLPLKALIYEDDEGKVWLAYNHPGYLSRRHKIKDRTKLVKTMSKILTNLTDLATKKK